MPFTQINIEKTIEEQKEKDRNFTAAYKALEKNMY